MWIHERLPKVQTAKSELALEVIKVIEKHELSAVEVVRILLAEATTWNTVALREERHPGDPEKKADEA